jgi:hypothetical protein
MTVAESASQERPMPENNNKDPNQKQPGEKEPGTFHFNPGNMSGKTVGTKKDDFAQSDGPSAHRNKTKQTGE